MDAVQYKGFYIVVKVEIDAGTKSKYRVVGQISRNPEGTPVLCSLLAFREFASAEAAYEFGLEEARTWIDNTG